MAYWLCLSCGHCMNVPLPPEECPHCRQKCSFANVTCYRPECGGEQNVDPLVVSALSARLAGGIGQRQGPR